MDASGTDLFFDRILSRKELQDSLATLFEVETDEIFITKSISNIEEVINEDIRILCETSLYNQEGCVFPFRVDVYLRDHNLASIKSESTFAMLCKTLSCQILMSDDSPSRLSWLLATAHGIKQVTFEIDRICNDDANEEYETL